jgi:prophage regulatory protein
VAHSSHSWRSGTVYVSVADLAARYSVARSTIWRWAASGRMPRPQSISPACTRWRLSDIEAWDAERDATQRGAA